MDLDLLWNYCIGILIVEVTIFLSFVLVFFMMSLLQGLV